MKAAWYDAFGPARDVLQPGDIEAPHAGRGEVLVRLKTSAVNPSDTEKRAGSFAGLLGGRRTRNGLIRFSPADRRAPA